MSFDNLVEVQGSLKIFQDLKFDLFFKNRKVLLSFTKLTHFAQVKDLLAKLQNDNIELQNANELPIPKINKATNILQSWKNQYPDKGKKLDLLINQIENTSTTTPRYTACTMLEAAKLHLRFPTAYKYLRDQKLLTLSHPSTLNQIKRSLDTKNSEVIEQNIE
ncbi:hypothetical protein ILUMI_25166 [Ignelater luminosus]|uniref:Uncharacterized protein n=1 Tax=Ignelater luminosus TaxID=2038154 RepID=A0A8K0C5W5_IGNLU|nr:hypothetical protein ILUMI_25166 [Ignelater luminosus]